MIEVLVKKITSGILVPVIVSKIGEYSDIKNSAFKKHLFGKLILA